MLRIYRGWFNQPSSLQPHHNLHGTYCIVYDRGEDTVRAYFTEGRVHSVMVPRHCITMCQL